MKLKKRAAKLLAAVPLRTHMSEARAEELLTKYHPSPSGVCAGNNEIDIQKDLHLVVAAYNVEKYVKTCLVSILRQKTDYSVLATVVDDGSTDRTGEIIQSVVNSGPKNERIEFEVLRQEHQGLSCARNAAMKRIRGRYVMILDADDALPEGTLDRLLRAADERGADLIQGSRFCFTEDWELDNAREIRGEATEDRKTFQGYGTGKLYRAEVLKRFQFPEGYWFEDTPVSFLLAALPYRYLYVPDAVYAYRFNPEGITATSPRRKKALDSFWITWQCLKEFPAFGLTYDLRAYEYLLRQSAMNARRTFRQPTKIRKAQFVLTDRLRKEFFGDMRTEDAALQKLEKALEQRRFIRFEMLVRGM